MKKVAHVISDTNIGGAGRWLLSFLSEARGYAYAAVVPEGSALIAPLAEIGVRAVTARGIGERSFSWAAVADLRRVFRRIAPDIVHSHAALSARAAAKSLGIKTVYTRHSVFASAPHQTRFPAKQLGGFAGGLLADAVIAVSPAAADNLRATGVDPRRITVVYNAARPVTPQPRDRVRFGLSEGDFVCACVARLTAVKGQEYLLRAAALLSGVPAIKFLIVGDGEDRERLTAAADELGLKNVVFTGFLEDVESAERVADLAVNVSYGTEATSLALLECMSLGIPAVATDYGGNPYVVRHGENGIIIPARDEKALAEAVLSMYNNETLYNAASAAARRVFAERFTLPAMVAATERIYTGVMGG
ncbi:MAG: glycosyltransferase family 4 protein [Clostridiales bacterium]|jgi:glycosyltransferase involved in cell wall biosynthesis|nr:glycosyltransferase family 4 protein [Clostridiales bacterium]